MKNVSLILVIVIFAFAQELKSQVMTDNFDYSKLVKKEITVVGSDSILLDHTLTMLKDQSYPFQLSGKLSDEVAELPLDKDMFFIVPTIKRIGESKANYQLSLIQGREGLVLGKVSQDGFYDLHQGLKRILYINVDGKDYQGSMNALYTHSLVLLLKFTNNKQKGMDSVLSENIYEMILPEILFDEGDLSDRCNDIEELRTILINAYIPEAKFRDQLMNDTKNTFALADCVREYTSDSTSIAHRYLYNWERGMIYHGESPGDGKFEERFDIEILEEWNTAMSKRLPQDYRRSPILDPSDRGGQRRR